MNVLIKETGALEELELLDAKTGLDYLDDLVADDPNMHRVSELDIYLCDQDTYKWREDVVTQHQTLNYRIQDLVEEYGSERVYDVLREPSYYSNDLELYLIYANRELDEEFGSINII